MRTATLKPEAESKSEVCFFPFYTSFEAIQEIVLIVTQTELKQLNFIMTTLDCIEKLLHYTFLLNSINDAASKKEESHHRKINGNLMDNLILR
jgi:hypothetical protein